MSRFFFFSLFAIFIGFIGEIFIFSEIENFKVYIFIFINVLVIKNKVERELNWVERVFVK